MANGQRRRHSAGLFDVRTIIGALLGIYGIVLLLVGLIGGSPTKHVSGGASTNIWVGVGLIVVSAFFLTWARLRPIIVDDAEVQKARTEAEEDGPGPAH